MTDMNCDWGLCHGENCPSCNGLKRYTYYIHPRATEERKLSAEDDATALEKLREEFGPHLLGVAGVFTVDEKGNTRTVWLE